MLHCLVGGKMYEMHAKFGTVGLPQEKLKNKKEMFEMFDAITVTQSVFVTAMFLSLTFGNRKGQN